MLRTTESAPAPTSARKRLSTILRKPWVIASLAISTVVVLVLALAVFQVQKLFIDERVDEAAPVFEAGPGASGIEGDEITEEMASGMNETMRDERARVEADDRMPMVEPSVLALGTFMSRSHPTSGRALVLGDGGERRVLRFEDFETDNGPALNVYLSAAAPDASKEELARDFVDLGRLRGNVGDQNYEVPEGVDLDRYKTVVVWCVRFSVAFGAAGLE